MKAQVPPAARNCHSSIIIRLGNNEPEVGYGSAKQKYGVGGMDQVWNRKYEPGPIRDGDRFNRIDICRIGPQERTGLQSWCPTSISSLADNNIRVGDLGLLRRPGKNSVQPSASNTMRS